MSKLGQQSVLLILLVFLYGCAANFVVVDRVGMTFSLSKVKLVNGNNIEILDGEAIRTVPLARILKLILDPSKTHYRDNKLYYHAIVEFVDGTTIKPRKTEGQITKSFVNIHNSLSGKGSSGSVSIPLEDVNVISQALIE